MSKGLRRRPLEMTRRDWRAWGRDLLRRCAERENKIRLQLLPPEFGLHDPDAPDELNAAEVRQHIELWAFGNIAARRDFLRVHQAKDRARRPARDDRAAELDALCTLLFESSQDGEDLGPEKGSAWVGLEGARSWAERIKGVMAEAAELRAAAFPNEDPENLAGPYGDGFDAVLGALARLTTERNEARAEVARLEAAAKCAYCGKQATCIGAYEAATDENFACDTCCGHGCEDGHCDTLVREDGDG